MGFALTQKSACSSKVFWKPKWIHVEVFRSFVNEFWYQSKGFDSNHEKVGTNAPSQSAQSEPRFSPITLLKETIHGRRPLICHRRVPEETELRSGKKPILKYS
jgi:hypothetical protein